MNTTCEQLEGAALALARSGSIKDRLAEAYRNHLALVDVQELPEVLRAEFRACSEALTREHPLRGEDAVRATVRKMSALEADELACSLVRLFASLVRECSRAEAPVEVAPVVDAAVAGSVRGKRKAVPQVISIYPAEAQINRA